MKLFHGIITAPGVFFQTLAPLIFQDILIIFLTGLLIVPIFLYITFKLKSSVILNISIWIIFAAYILYTLSHLTHPFFEGDAGNIIAGAIQVARSVRNPILYNYMMQPLTYHLLSFLIRLTPINSILLSTMFAQIGLFIILTLIYLTSKQFKSQSYALGLLAMNLLIHELLIEGAYYNTNIYAMVFLYLAIYILIKNNYTLIPSICSAILLSIAFFVRVDIILMIPIFIVLLVLAKQYKPLAAATITFTIALILGALMLKINPASMNSISKNHFEVLYIISRPIIHTFLAMPFVLILLSILGFFTQLFSKNYRTILLVLASYLPLFFFYARANTTPKYMLYVYPVMAWMAMEGFIYLKNYRNKFIGATILSGLFVMLFWQMILSGLVFSMPDEGLIPLVKRRNIVTEQTHDAPRPLTGIAFYPLTVSQRQYRFNARIARMQKAGEHTNIVYWVNWDYYGSLNSIYSQEAERIEKDSVNSSRNKFYHLADKTTAHVIEIRYDSSNENLRDDFNNLLDKGYRHVFLVNRQSVFENITMERKNSLKFLNNFGDKALIVVEK